MKITSDYFLSAIRHSDEYRACHKSLFSFRRLLDIGLLGGSLLFFVSAFLVPYTAGSVIMCIVLGFVILFIFLMLKEFDITFDEISSEYMFSKHNQKKANKILKSWGIAHTVKDIEKMSNEELEELAAHEKFSHLRALNKEEIMQLDQDIKKYGSEGTIKYWHETINKTRDTPGFLLRKEFKEGMNRTLQERENHLKSAQCQVLEQLRPHVLIDDALDDVLIEEKSNSSFNGSLEKSLS